MRIRYTPRSFRELEEIFAYIDERSPMGARNVKARVYATVRFIASHPYAGTLTPIADFAELPRILSVSDFLSCRSGRIHGIRHGARNPSSMPR